MNLLTEILSDTCCTYIYIYEHTHIYISCFQLSGVKISFFISFLVVSKPLGLNTEEGALSDIKKLLLYHVCMIKTQIILAILLCNNVITLS